MQTYVPNRKYYIFYSCLQKTSNMQDPREQTNPPNTHISWFNRQVMHRSPIQPYINIWHYFSVTLHSYVPTSHHHIFLCQIYANAIRTTANQHQVTHIPSTTSIVYYYTKVLLSKNYFHFSFIEKEHNYVMSP